MQISYEKRRFFEFQSLFSGYQYAEKSNVYRSWLIRFENASRSSMFYRIRKLLSSFRKNIFSNCCKFHRFLKKKTLNKFKIKFVMNTIELKFFEMLKKIFTKTFMFRHFFWISNFDKNEFFWFRHFEDHFSIFRKREMTFHNLLIQKNDGLWTKLWRRRTEIIRHCKRL